MAGSLPGGGDQGELLHRQTKSMTAAQEALVAQIYDELRRLAAGYMRHERSDHTLQATALVHEAYVRLIRYPDAIWESRAHFLACASRIMREILVDHARVRNAVKRGGSRVHVTLDDSLSTISGNRIEVLVLDEALNRLMAFDERQARLLEMHFFGGLPFEEIASVLGFSERTIKREWAMARAWLRTELSK